MFTLGPIAFASPWILASLALVPLAYFIIRAIPPAPRRMFFPATWLTRQLKSENTTSQAAPWWLVLLRLIMLVLLILALSGPSLSRGAADVNTGPAILLIDNDWSSAPDWEARRAVAQDLIKRFGERSRDVAIAYTAPPLGGWAKTQQRSFVSGALAAQSVAVMDPVAWKPDYAGAVTQIEALTQSLNGQNASISYLTNGIDHDEAGLFLSSLNATAPLEIIALKNAGLRQIAIANVKSTGTGFDVLLIRKPDEPSLNITLSISDPSGTLLASENIRFGANVEKVDATLSVPPLLRGRVARLSIDGTRHAGATYIFDARAQRPLVGIVTSDGSMADQPLQTPFYYLSRALQPFATIERGTVEALTAKGVSILLLPDQARLVPSDEDAALAWLGRGGTLIRFSGPNLFASDDLRGDALLPTRLRPEPRVVGGALSWSAAQPLARFDAQSPFFGIEIAEDIRVEKQALVRTGSAQQAKVWAALADGTPLVTARSEGNGTIALFHTSANAAWSNLALSGTFVEMLQRLIQIGGPSQTSAASGETMRLTKMLTGHGQLVSAREQIAAVSRAQLQRTASSALQPPGVYEGQRNVLAINLAASAGPLTPRTALRSMEASAGALPYRIVDGPRERSLLAPLLIALFCLAIIDMAATLVLHGNPGLKVTLPKWRFGQAAAVITLLAVISPYAFSDAVAQSDTPGLLAENVRLACLKSGSADVDALCMNGLNSLSRQLNLRTSVWTGPAQMIDPARDDLGFYPVIYWPVTAQTKPLGKRVYERLNTYLQTGGMLIIDLGVNAPGKARMDVGLPAEDMLADIRRHLSVPPLSALNKDHVLTHSFYILKTAPGRRGDGTVWVEAGGEDIGADVSPIIMGATDWLSAWSQAQTSLPGYASGKGRDTELAVRFGINAVMYALTGTYKADQVHLPALLDRVGRED